MKENECNSPPTCKESTVENHNIIQWNNLTIETVLNNRIILDNVTGEVKSGRSLAIMGSSGAGKTTFLNYLSKKNSNGLAGLRKKSGTVKFIANKVDETKSFSMLSGYVTQDDILFEVLSPRELLTFAADIRLPHKNKTEKEKIIENLIIRLGLEKCADTKVGDVQSKGLSGGERKRTAIGYELISDPLIMFLDEPTTGLDSISAYNVIQLITDEARLNNRIIIFTIHQPNSEILNMFDQLMLMSQGKVVFHDDSRIAMSYFYNLGYKCPPHFNPAEFYIKILSKEARVVEKLDLTTSWLDYKRKNSKYSRKYTAKSGNINTYDSEKTDSIGNVFEIKKNSDDDDNDETEKSLEGEDVAFKLRRTISNLAENNEDEIKKEAMEYDELIKKFADKSKGNLKISDISDYPINKNKLKLARNTFFVELGYLLRRNNKISLRNKKAFMLRFITTFFNSILIILIFSSLGTGDNAVRDRNGCLFFITTSIVQANLQMNLLLLTSEKPKFYKEQDNSMYGVLTYFLSKTLLEIPLQVVFSLLFFIMTYFATGLNDNNVGNYFIYILIIFLAGYTGSTFAMFLSSIIDRKEIVPAIFPFLVYTQIQASGFTVSLKNIPYIFYPFKYISVFRYCYESLCWNEYTGLTSESLNCNNEIKCKFPTEDFEENIVSSMLSLATIAIMMNVFSVVALKLKVVSRKIK